MFFKIYNLKSKLINSFLLDFGIFLFLLAIYNSVFFYRIDILILNFFIWIILSYIIGRFHDFKQINRETIIKNIFKTFVVSLFLINFCFILERVFFSDTNYRVSFNDLLYFYFFFGIISIVINLGFNLIFLKNKKNKKWIILKGNYLIKCLEKDNIESKNFLQKNLMFISEIKNIDFSELNKVSGIIIEKNKELSRNDEELILAFKNKGILILGNLEWCEIFLHRIPPKVLNDELHRKKILYPKYNVFEYRFKRICEFFISLFFIFLSSPIILIASYLIYREDKGTIFYSQIRQGFYGKNIRIYKLRTMKINSEKNGPQWSTTNDKRITKIGHFLRKTRIDEIPQLFSVIKGEMSLIGPRPERPEIDNQLEKKIIGYKSRYNILPGITGWAQVNYPYGASIHDTYNKLSFDFYYLRNFSIFLDLLILFKTARVVIKYENASFQS